MRRLLWGADDMLLVLFFKMLVVGVREGCGGVTSDKEDKDALG